MPMTITVKYMKQKIMSLYKEFKENVLINKSVSKEKRQKVLYHELCYAGDTWLSLPKSSEIFHLCKGNKRLPIKSV